jgi:hypothetical protein
MTGTTEAFKINLNQNLWGLIVAFGSLSLSEHYQLCTLFLFSVVVSSVMTLSNVITSIAKKSWPVEHAKQVIPGECYCDLGQWHWERIHHDAKTNNQRTAQ